MKRNLFKKLTSMLLAIMMLLSVMPMMAFATPNGDYWEELNYFTFDNMTQTINNDSQKRYTKTSANGLTQTVNMNATYSSTDANFSRLHGNTAPSTVDWFQSNWYTTVGENALTNWPIDRDNIRTGWLICKNYVSVGNKGVDGKPNDDLRVYDLFNPTDTEYYDKVKITSWVYPANALQKETTDGTTTYTDPTDTEDMQCAIRFWLSDDRTGTAYNAYNPNTNVNQDFIDETYVTTVPFKQWSEISFTYDVVNYDWHKNKDVTSVRIDTNDPVNSTFYYPRNMLVAGVKVEKFVKAEGSYSINDETGAMTGTVTAGLDKAVTAGTHQVIVAAYDGDMFLGCDMIDYTNPDTFDFTIANAKGADSVRAYLWNMTTFEPEITPITLTKAQ